MCLNLIITPPLFSLPALRADAESEASFSKYSAFYQSIAHLVPGFTPPSDRGSFALSIALPEGAEEAIAVLSAEGLDFPENVLNDKAKQYWGEIHQGLVEIPNVAEGTYRLTVYAKG